MSNDFPASLKQVAAAPLPSSPWIEVFPLQPPRVEVKIWRLKFVRADEEFPQCREILVIRSSDGGESSTLMHLIGSVGDLGRATLLMYHIRSRE